MTFRNFVLKDLSMSAMVGGWALLLSLISFFRASHTLAGTLFSVGLLAASILIFWSGTQFVPFLRQSRIVKVAKVTIKVPESETVHVDLAQLSACQFIVFINEIGPRFLSGSFSLVSDDGEAKVLGVLKLTKPKSYRALDGSERWSHTVQTRRPLKLAFRRPENISVANLKIELTWNFEGTYLDPLIPRNRLVTVEVVGLKEFKVERLK